MLSSFARSWSGGGLQVYTVHEQPNPPADRIDRAEALKFVRDGFSWGALLFGPLWLIAKARWSELAVYVAATAIIIGLTKIFGGGQNALSLAVMALNAILAFEASALERLTLDRAGWQEIGTVSGRDAAECERRFFETWLPNQPIIANLSHMASAAALGASDVGRPSPSAKLGWRATLSRIFRT